MSAKPGPYSSPEALSSQAERAIASVAEAECPLCKVELRIHGGCACCPCCGDSCRAEPGRLEMEKCAEHGRTCLHWDAVWAARTYEEGGSDWRHD